MHCGDQRLAGMCLGWGLCKSRRLMSGRSQGTTLSASDLHNARATILNPLYHMKYKIIKKIRQNTTWTKVVILGINLTPSQYNALAPAIVYVSNGVTIRGVTIATQRTLLQAHVKGTEIVLKSTVWRSNLSIFLYVQGPMHGCLINNVNWTLRGVITTTAL